MGDGGNVTICRPGPGLSRQWLRHRAEALEGGFCSNIACCWRQRLHRAAPLERGHVLQSCWCLQRRLFLRGSASRRVGFDRASPRAAAPDDHGMRLRRQRDRLGGARRGRRSGSTPWCWSALRARGFSPAPRLPAMTAVASCSARRCSPRPATRQPSLLLVGSSGVRLSADAKAARDDCGGFLFGSVVLAEASDHAPRPAAGRFFRRAALRRRQGCPR